MSPQSPSCAVLLLSFSRFASRFATPSSFPIPLHPPPCALSAIADFHLPWHSVFAFIELVCLVMRDNADALKHGQYSQRPIFIRTCQMIRTPSPCPKFWMLNPAPSTFYRDCRSEMVLIEATTTVILIISQLWTGTLTCRSRCSCSSN